MPAAAALSKAPAPAEQPPNATLRVLQRGWAIRWLGWHWRWAMRARLVAEPTNLPPGCP